MMPGILPFASYHPIWSPIAGEIHAVIWDGVGLGKVHVFLEEWAKTWVADCITEDQQQENFARVRLELGFPEDWTLGLIADNLPDDKRIRQASDMLHDWQLKLPELPLPPSHRSRFAAEKWAALAAVHDVFDLSGDKVLPWSLPEDDYDLLALTEWMRGNGGAFSLLMRRASELRDSDSSVILRWLADVSNDTAPKDKKSNDHSQPATPSAMADVEKVKQDALLLSLSLRNRNYVFCGRIWSEYRKQQEALILQGSRRRTRERVQIAEAFPTAKANGWPEDKLDDFIKCAKEGIKKRKPWTDFVKGTKGKEIPLEKFLT